MARRPSQGKQAPLLDRIPSEAEGSDKRQANEGICLYVGKGQYFESIFDAVEEAVRQWQERTGNQLC